MNKFLRVLYWFITVCYTLIGVFLVFGSEKIFGLDYLGWLMIFYVPVLIAGIVKIVRLFKLRNNTVWLKIINLVSVLFVLIYLFVGVIGVYNIIYFKWFHEGVCSGLDCADGFFLSIILLHLVYVPMVVFLWYAVISLRKRRIQ